VVEKAETLMSIFGDKELGFYCEVVKSSGNLPIDVLIENLLQKN